MASFSTFLKSFDADGVKRGRQFEHFVKWFLKNDPEWATQVDEVWLWNDYPGQWGRDCGIDLVFKDKNKKTWAVQAKCYSPDYEITKSDVDKFLSESNRKKIDHRLLIATTDRIGANARQVLAAQEKSVVRYHLTHFESAAVDYPDSIERLSVAKRKPPPELDRPYQIEAIDKVISAFQTADRGQLVMACGTGKTFICLWVKERLKAKRTLVLVPSLGLLSQILSDWTFAAREQFDALCVCSDQTVNKDEEDEPISFVSDLPFPVTSDVSEIAHFLKQDRHQVIFATYQSSPLIAEAQKNNDPPHFDLVIADEAHRCAGKSDSPFQTVLDDGLIKSDRRLFATATPRVYRASLKKTAEEFGVEVADMSDEKSFGKRFHTLTFGEAIKLGWLTDYRVLIVGVDNERIKEWIENRRLVATDTGLATDARSLAGQIGLLKAIKDWNLRRLISFHGRVKRAREFSEDIIQVGEWLDAEHKPSGNLWAEYVSGEMPTIDRKKKLSRLRNVGKDAIGLLSNARCLSEGVDVPALDGVAFIDPRSSEIDIIQSVGRAIRLSDDKTMGTIVLPVFIDQTDDAEKALRASEFKPIWDVLEALKSHDERLSDELDQLRIDLGAKRKRSVGANDLAKIVLDLPTTVNEDFAQALRAYLVAQTTESWMFWYGLLETFVKEHGHCRVSQVYKTDEGYRLGKWVRHQRENKNTMEADRRQRLEAMPGWSWDILSDQWEKGFSHLKQYSDREGHCRLPKDYKTNDGYRLAQWVGAQKYTKNIMDPVRRQRLEALPGWSWAVHLDQWEEGFSHLKRFSEREGHCRVSVSYKTDGGYSLGQWVSDQRKYKDTMEPDRRQRLEALPVWSWDVLSDLWEDGFSHLKEFSDREGHCRVAKGYTTDDGYRLAQWVGIQRSSKDTMDPDRRQRLEALPSWSWDVLSDQWEKGFSHLKQFSNREGHCRVAIRYTTDDGYRLGLWVRNQRDNKNAMDPNRRQRLEALPGWSWDVLSDQWEEGFSHLKQYSDREGHCRVAIRYTTDDGYRLGLWVRDQRYNKNTMEANRRQRLEALPGWSWDVLSDQWEEGFSHLKQYSDREGHCRVAATYKTNDGYRLGKWVSHQRDNKNTMEANRRQRLEALPGWSWDVLSDQWEEGFSHLKQYSDREGHCRVSQSYKTEGGYPLGFWVSRQRTRKDKIDPDRRKRLEATPGWSWDALSEQWEDGFSHLKEFSDRERHCRVPAKYRTDDGYRLGRWLIRQRDNRDTMDPDRRQRLEALPGWVWKVEKPRNHTEENERLVKSQELEG
jgi:superfamily II DNA or RNA helicase